MPAEVRRRIGHGKLAGVILFDTNFDSASEAASLIDELQSIPRPRGLREPLLVMVDQEGGLVKRLPGPPDLSAAEMGAAGKRTCWEQGAATGSSLRGIGFNVDLAPVLDVGRPGSAIESEGRSFGTDPKGVARCADAFATALERKGVAPTAKHFPGIGAAAVNTDDAVQRIELSARELRHVDERPYRRYARGGGAGRLVMVSSAVYPAFSERPAALDARPCDGRAARPTGLPRRLDHRRAGDGEHRSLRRLDQGGDARRARRLRPAALYERRRSRTRRALAARIAPPARLAEPVRRFG